MGVIFTWDHVRYYESFDYVSEIYERIHNRYPEKLRIKEINSCFEQARHYIESASQGAETVRPVLIYYGCLALARASIILRNPDRTENNIRPGHGLITKHWQNVLGARSPNLLKLSVTACGGTFSQFCETYKGLYSIPVDQRRDQAAVSFSPLQCPFPLLLNDGSTVSLQDLLARDPSIGGYREFVGEPPKYHYIFPNDVVLTKERLTIDILILPHHNAELMKVLFPKAKHIGEITKNDGIGLSRYYRIIYEISPPTLVTERHYSIKLPSDLPICLDRHILEPLQNGDRISILHIRLMMAFIFSNISRYYSSKWMMLIRNDKGGKMAPLFRKALKEIENTVPDLIIKDIRNFAI